MAYTPATEKLIAALQTLPGVGTRSAQRMALHLLERDTVSAQALTEALQTAVENVHKCPQCRSLTEAELCDICADTSRKADVLCVVSNDADKAGIEMAAKFDGRYYVLHGVLSPIDGIGPQELGIFQLIDQVKSDDVQEVILALDDQLEAEATVHYISEQLRTADTKLSRIQFQQMKSGSLDRADSRVIEQAIANKQTIGFEHD